jgi:hypothetical protein
MGLATDRGCAGFYTRPAFFSTAQEGSDQYEGKQAADGFHGDTPTEEETGFTSKCVAR